jgi:hypothetical protein
VTVPCQRLSGNPHRRYFQTGFCHIGEISGAVKRDPVVSDIDLHASQPNLSPRGANIVIARLAYGPDVDEPPVAVAPDSSTMCVTHEDNGGCGTLGKYICRRHFFS